MQIEGCFQKENCTNSVDDKTNEERKQRRILCQTGKEKQWIQRRKEPRRLDGEFLLVGHDYNLP